MDFEGSPKPLRSISLQSLPLEGPQSPATNSENGLSLAEAHGEPTVGPYSALTYFLHYFGPCGR